MLTNLKEAKAEAEKDGNTKLANKLNDEVIGLEKIIAEEANAAKIFKEEFDSYEKLVKKLNEKKPSDLTPEEQRLLIEGTAFLTNMEWSMYKEMLENPDAAYQMGAKELYKTTPDKLTTKQKEFIIKEYEGKVNDLEKLNSLMNETTLNDLTDSQIKNKFADNFDVRIVSGKDKGKYNIEIEAPNGKIVAPKLELLKNLSKKQAELVTKNLKERIKEIVNPPTDTAQQVGPGPGQKIYLKVLSDKSGYEKIPGTEKYKQYYFTKQEAIEANKEATFQEAPKKMLPDSEGVNLNNPNTSGNQSSDAVLNQLIHKFDLLTKLVQEGKPGDAVSVHIPMARQIFIEKSLKVDRVINSTDKTLLSEGERKKN